MYIYILYIYNIYVYNIYIYIYIHTYVYIYAAFFCFLLQYESFNGLLMFYKNNMFGETPDSLN